MQSKLLLLWVQYKYMRSYAKIQEEENVNNHEPNYGLNIFKLFKKMRLF